MTRTARLWIRLLHLTSFDPKEVLNRCSLYQVRKSLFSGTTLVSLTGVITIRFETELCCMLNASLMGEIFKCCQFG